jgi:hypothetical protein
MFLEVLPNFCQSRKDAEKDLAKKILLYLKGKNQ